MLLCSGIDLIKCCKNSSEQELEAFFFFLMQFRGAFCVRFEKVLCRDINFKIVFVFGLFVNIFVLRKETKRKKIYQTNP